MLFRSDRLCAGWRRHPEDIRHHKAPHPGVQLGGAHRDFAWKMLFQWKGRYRIEGPAFVYSDDDTGQVATILGYPTDKLTQAV